MKNSGKLNRALGRGERSYNTFLGDWWYGRSHDACHRRAYEIIVERVARRFRIAGRAPQWIVDYACGNAAATAVLARRFPRARIVAIDGSERMLVMARYDLRHAGYDAEMTPAPEAFSSHGPRIRLISMPLPDFSFPLHKADAVLFMFPNMNFSAAQTKRLKKNIFGNRRDRDLARFLSRLPDLDHPAHPMPPAEIYEDLLYERAISSNIHGMLKRGGFWFKIDYSNSFREDLSDLIQWRMLFSESAFDPKMEEKPERDPFEFVDSTYRHSKVILDVYEQTHQATDKKGGYMITTFRAR